MARAKEIVAAQGVDAREKQQAAEFNVEMIADMVGQMNKLLTSLAASSSFKDTGLGLAEWIALKVIAATEGATNKLLSKRLGITPQRVAQISESLRDSAIIEAVRVEGDSRKRILKVTEKGAARLMSIDEALKASLVDPHREVSNLMVRTSKGLKKFNRMVVPIERPAEAVQGAVGPSA